MYSLSPLFYLLILSSSILSAQNAILVKDRVPVTKDLITEQDAKRYGPNDNLDGPAIENKYFAFFVPLMKGSINGDLIAKRKNLQVLSLFKKDTKRHKKNDWGEDIISTKNAFGAGYFAVMLNGEAISPSWENTESIEINIVSDKAEDTEINIIFNGWKIGDKKIDAKWIITTNWEARWIKHELQFSKDFKHQVRFGLTKHLKEYSLNKKKIEVIGLGDQTYPKVSPKKLLMAVKASKENFVEFFTSKKNVGVLTKPNENGYISAWTTYSWAGEPAPLFSKENWQGLLFKGIE